MKNSLNDRLLLLATAQECIRNLSDKMEIWNESQLNSEKNAFDSVNISDYVLNMSREGNRLITTLQDHYRHMDGQVSSKDSLAMYSVMNEIKNLFVNISKASLEANDISHRIEEEIAYQKEIGESIKGSFVVISETIDATAACVEMMMTDY